MKQSVEEMKSTLKEKCDSLTDGDMVNELQLVTELW